MSKIRLYNTMTRAKAAFAPLDATNVRIYVCGPTVYDRAHLGNGRPVVVFDVLYRLLRHVYGAGHVTYVRNFTDVDDKINATGLARKAAGDPRSLEALIHERTEETIGWYHADMDELGALRPSIRGVVSSKAEPRATEYIGERIGHSEKFDGMIGMIQTLIERKNAYVVREPSNDPPREYVLMDRESVEHALFDVESWKENYGRLSGNTLEGMIEGARGEVAPHKKNPSDFVLWKPSDVNLPGWASPWGRGRPGWHIECSAMALALLGESFDIHGGGLDLQFPHHENEIAQSCCALATKDDPFGEEKFARLWMHNEMVQVEGRKMSKSLGNFFTVRDLLDQKVLGPVIRFVFLSTHYRKPMDWTAEKAEQAEATLRKWAALVNDRPAVTQKSSVPGRRIDPLVVAALSDDLNTHAAIQRLHELYGLAQDASNEGNRALARLYHSAMELLGIDLLDVHEALRPRTTEDAVLELEMKKVYNELTYNDQIKQLISLRSDAKKARDFMAADRIRDLLAQAGVVLTDTASGPKWEIGVNFDAAKLEALK